jgi:putative ABC transport system permease protein
MAMLRNYVVSALRSIRKNKLTSTIAILGFSIGIAAALFIFLYVRYELSFDKFIAGHDRIYRLLAKAENIQGEGFTTAALDFDIKQQLLSRADGIEEITQVSTPTAIIGFEDKSFFESGVYMTDSSFFKVLEFPLAYGDPATVLDKPFSIVISRAAAKKYFGDLNPIGRILKFRGNFLGDTTYDCAVTGLLAPLPPNSTFAFDFAVSLPPDRVKSDAAAYYNRAYDIGISASDVQLRCLTYVKLKNAAFYPRFRMSFDDALAASSMSRQGFRFKKFRLMSECLDDIHLFTAGSSPSERRGDLRKLLIIIALALIVIGIACINVINLTTARAMTRMKEIGIRKTLGATRRELIAQYLVESVLLCLLSLWIAAAIVELLLPGFNGLFRTNLSLRYLGDPAYIAAAVGIAVAIGLLSGLYPALYLSQTDIVKVLKGQRTPSSRRFREGMVILQFVVSIGLFIAASVILREFESVKTTDLGFDPSDTVMTQLNIPEVERKFPDIKRRLQAVSGVLGVSASSYSGWKYGELAKDFQLGVQGRRGTCDIMVVDPDYLRVQKIRLSKGKDFDPDFRSDDGGQLIVNEPAAKSLGLGPGTIIRYNELVGQVVGIAENFDYLFPAGRIRPLIMTTKSPLLISDSFQPVPVHLNYVIVKITSADRARVLSDLEKAWKDINPGYAFEYRLVDEEIARQLDEANLAFEYVLKLCTILAFALSGLGLFGLSTYEIERRTKEVGIRKALGATSLQVAGHFLRGFFLLAAIANLIAWPLAFALVRGIFALVQFPHPLLIGPAAFIEAGAISFALTGVTVGTQTLRAASANPVNALRYE